MSRYLYGVRFRPATYASRWPKLPRAAPPVAIEKILLFCFHYDPVTALTCCLPPT